MNLNVGCNVGAVLKLVVRKASTDEIVKETPEFKNLVLTTGLSRMAVGTWIDRCVVGTGSSTPVASQVSLDSFLASTTTTATGVSDTGGIQVTTAPYYWYGRRTWRFAVGTATGNISEVGLGWGNSNLWNRALIKDVNGNPTTITVLADEYLDVVSEVRVYPQESTGSFNLVDKVGAVISTHTVNIRPRFNSTQGPGASWTASVPTVGRSDGLQVMGFSTGSIPSDNTGLPPSLTTVSGGIVSTPQPRGENFKRVITSGEVNIGTHKSFCISLRGLMCGSQSTNVVLNASCGYNWEVDPPIPKDAETILTYSFTLTWDNHTST